jgi:hypothetical protein
LKQKALSTPAELPENAWQVLIQENRALAKGNVVGDFTKAMAAKYKSLSAEEKEVRTARLKSFVLLSLSTVLKSNSQWQQDCQ